MARSSLAAFFGVRPALMSRIASALTPAFSAIGAWACHSYWARHSRAVHRIANSDSRGSSKVLKRMHIDAERAAKLDAVAARSSAHGFEQCALGVVELVLGYYRQAVIQLLGSHAVLVSATSEWRPQGRTFFRAPGKGLADHLTFAAERPELLRLTLRSDLLARRRAGRPGTRHAAASPIRSFCGDAQACR